MQCLIIVIIAIALFLCACIIFVEVRAFQRKRVEEKRVLDELDQFHGPDSIEPWDNTTSDHNGD